ncbi:MAG TPA: HNH endonuclease signature motif containing protein [Ferrovaceae bacterium]|jgi:hypothetical protein|nr:HNH endonuclease signature motif containing protein [Ferrovaceae bacterium]
MAMTEKEKWKRKYQLQKKNGEVEKFLERQKARRLYDKLGIDRKGKQIDHKKHLNAGGKTTAGNLRLRDPSANMADNGRVYKKKK